ncbi:MAG: succinate--CoA ligase subunit beta [candidate division WOR-3 bacterium]|nr:succinate--CoA ligase subunit beta [candidate division WOR-3 bacterium]
MRLYEFEGKMLFKRKKIPVPEGVVIDKDTISELDKVFYPVVIKAQVFAGGRGKAGIIQFAQNRLEAEKKIIELLGKKHGPFVIEKVLVERKLDIEQELYIAALIDRIAHKPLLMLCLQGGVDIEEIAKANPGAIRKYYFNAGEKLFEFQAKRIAGELGFSSDLFSGVANVIFNLYNLFIDYECKLAEINPLVITKDRKVFALDAKVDLDEDAMFRHPDLREMGIVARNEIGELTEREKIAKAAGIPYADVDPEGDIGVFPGGAGFGIAALDLITHYGGRPSNFMDSGGAPTQEKLKAMLGLLMDNPKVKVIFGARFGGISRCDDWAKAVVQYILENKPQKPMIMRMAGNMEEEGRKIFEEAKKEHPELFKNIKIYAYDTPIEEVIKEAIRVAKETT